MYIRKTTKSHKGKTYTNYLLVESVSTPKGPRQRIICSLGSLAPGPPDQWLDLARRLEASLKGQASLLPADPQVEALIEKARQAPGARTEPMPQSKTRSATRVTLAVDTERVTMEQAREAGSVHVGHQMWQQLRLNEILTAAELSARACQLSEAMTLNRLVFPLSEHAMPDWIERTALSDILAADFSAPSDEALYRNLDRLHPNREAIERELAEREKTLFHLDDTVYLYDLTSTYFEGHAARNAQAKRGYSRDKRPDAKQVLVGLVLDRDGFPKAHEIFEGNRQDRSTVKEMLESLEKRTGPKPGTTVVVDRGMAYEEDLAEIRSHGYHYLVAGRLKERYPRVARYYRIDCPAEPKTLAWEEDGEKKAIAEKLDGGYVLKTDRLDLTADEIWRTYILLTRVEAAFRAMKSPLAERPIFHQLERRTQTHIFLCILAYHLLVAIEKRFLDAGMHTSWWTLRQQLSTHQVVTVVLPTGDGRVLKIRKGTTPEPVHREIYSTLRIPEEVMKPVKTWHEISS
jgi:Transposase DDE domain